jgi:rare lipoprotein A
MKVWQQFSVLLFLPSLAGCFAHRHPAVRTGSLGAPSAGDSSRAKVNRGSSTTNGSQPQIDPDRRECQQGQATYYADSLAGNKTANGEIYHPYLMSAAHRTLKMGTVVKVLWGEKSIVVRINDRGPYSPGAIIDLSRKAAEQLGMIRAGRIPVWVCPVLVAILGTHMFV